MIFLFRYIALTSPLRQYMHVYHSLAEEYKGKRVLFIVFSPRTRNTFIKHRPSCYGFLLVCCLQIHKQSFAFKQKYEAGVAERKR